MTPTSDKKIRVLAVASVGGHWEQLMLLHDLLDSYDVTYATTEPGLISLNAIAKSYIVSDCNRNTPFELVKSLTQAIMVVIKVKPQVVISTGALPGLLCLIFGRVLGARTIWLDSVANAEKLSMCGNIARYISTVCVTQWKHLAVIPRVRYFGSIL
jgi:UDP-N-acetylglucosamine:LPS N-acetylglucosamine transferase